MKAQRTTAAKCVLAVRMDVNQSHADGSYGRTLLLDLEKKLEKLQEPPPSKVIKALPVPREGPTKRRGGKKCVFVASCAVYRSFTTTVLQSKKSKRSICDDRVA